MRDRVDDVTTGALRLLALPTDVAPMDNAACRAAVAAALDRQALQKALGGADDVVRRSQLWPRGLPGGPAGPRPRAPDLDAARALADGVRQARRASRTVLAVADTPSQRRPRRTRSPAQLAAVGITAEVRPLDATHVLRDRRRQARTTWPRTATASCWPPGRRTSRRPARSWRRWSTAAASGRVGNTNYAQLDDPAVNALIDKARAGGGADAWRAVAAAVAKTSAYVPLAETRIQLLAGQRLRNGVVMQPYSGYDVATAGVR